MIKPCGHRVVVKPYTLEEHDPVFASAKKLGIELTRDTEKMERTGVDRGYVLSLGATAFKDFGGEPWCKVGDLIAYARHSGKFVEDPANKEKLLVLNDEDVIAVLTEK